MAGLLQQRVLKNFDRLEEDTYQPQNVYTTGQSDLGWPGDTEGRAILGLTLDAQATHRAPKYLDDIPSLYRRKRMRWATWGKQNRPTFSASLVALARTKNHQVRLNQKKFSLYAYEWFCCVTAAAKNRCCSDDHL